MRLLSGLLAISITFAFTSSTRRADDSSGKILSFRGLRAQPRYKRMAEKEPTTLDGLHGPNFTHPLYLLPLPRFWISIFGIELGHFMPFTSWISIFGNELRLALPCLDWMSTWLALRACLLWNQPSLKGFLPLCCPVLLRPSLDKLD